MRRDQPLAHDGAHPVLAQQHAVGEHPGGDPVAAGDAQEILEALVEVRLAARADAHQTGGGEELARDFLEVLDRDALRARRLVVDAERAREVARLGEHDVDVLRKRVDDGRLEADLGLVEHRVQRLPCREASHVCLARSESRAPERAEASAGRRGWSSKSVATEPLQGALRPHGSGSAPSGMPCRNARRSPSLARPPDGRRAGQARQAEGRAQSAPSAARRASTSSSVPTVMRSASSSPGRAKWRTRMSRAASARATGP